MWRDIAVQVEILGDVVGVASSQGYVWDKSTKVCFSVKGDIAITC
jgi:hypothetical protein